MPEWISHRGLAQDVTENTIAAFEKSAALNFDRIETDLRSTKDGKLVLCHDPSFERLSASNVETHKMNWSEISKIKLTRGGEPALLDHLVDAFTDMPTILDVKPELGESTTLSLIKFIKERHLEEKVKDGFFRFLFWKREHQELLLNAFQNAHCYARMDQCYPVGLASLARLSWLVKPNPNLIYSLPSSFKGVKIFRKEVVNRFHRTGTKLLAFLPENQEQTQDALNAGFDQILTNHPNI